MKELLIEFLGNILNEAKKPAKMIAAKKVKTKRVARQPGTVWQTAGKKWSAKRMDGTPEYGFDSEEAARAWLAGTEKAPKKIGSTGMNKDPDADLRAQIAKDLRDPAKLAAMKGDVPTSPKQKRASSEEQKKTRQDVSKTFQKLYDAVELGGGPTAVAELKQFIEVNDIQFKAELGKGTSNRFYCLKGLTQKNRMFLDMTPTQQRAMYDMLTHKAKIDVPLRGKKNPFAFENVIPPFEVKLGSEVMIQSSGSIVINGQQIQTPADVSTFVDARVAEWKETHKNDADNIEKVKDVTLQLTTIGNAILTRHKVLAGLQSESIAVFTADNQTAYYQHLSGSMLATTESEDTKAKISALFKKLEGNELVPQILHDIFKEAEKDSELSKFIPALAENLSAIYELKQGRQVILPIRDNNTTMDVISLSTVELPDNPTVDQLLEQVNLIFSGVSVKRGRGGASSMLDKTEYSVYEDHASTMETLRKLNSVKGTSIEGGTQTRTDLFDPNTTAAKTAEILSEVQNNISTLTAYYGLPDSTTAEQFMDIFSNGSLVCGANPSPPPSKIPVKRPTEPAPISTYGAEMSDDNKTMYRTYFAMLAAWEAIYNSKVISQGFESHSWSTSRGLSIADGVTQMSKQYRTIYKNINVRKNSDGKVELVKPDASVSHNAVGTTSLRSSNPCEQGKKK